MSDDFNGLRTRLAELADAPAPTSPFDPAQVAGVGRRRVLARRTSAFGGGGALAVAAVIGVVTAFGPAAQPTTANTGAPTDPMVKLVDFGWLPAALPNVSYVAVPDSSANDVIAQGDKSPDGAPRVDLRLLPGSGPGSAGEGERMIPATLNDGRQAYWVTQAPAGGRFDGVVQLRFPTEDGRWLSLTWGVNWNQADISKIAGVPKATTTQSAAAGATYTVPPATVPVSSEWQQTLLHIATRVTNRPADIPLPFRVNGLPQSFRPGVAYLWRPGAFGENAPGTWTALITFVSGDLTATIEADPHDASPTATALEAPGTACTTSAGLDICVQASGSSPDFDRIGRAKGLLSHVTPLGPDEKQWTKEVIVP